MLVYAVTQTFWFWQGQSNEMCVYNILDVHFGHAKVKQPTVELQIFT